MTLPTLVALTQMPATETETETHTETATETSPPGLLSESARSGNA